MSARAKSPPAAARPAPKARSGARHPPLGGGAAATRPGGLELQGSVPSARRSCPRLRCPQHAHHTRTECTIRLGDTPRRDRFWPFDRAGTPPHSARRATLGSDVTNRTRVAALAGAVLVATGCSTTTKGNGIGPAYTTVAGLAAALAHANAQLKSEHGSLHLSAGPVDETGTFSG